jgi:DNA-binding NarL/FixJ family response regulator
VVLVDADANPEGARRLLGAGEQPVPVVVLVAGPHTGAAALAAGARAVVRRGADLHVLVAALAAAASGLVAFDPAVADARAAADRSEDRVVEELTPRESEVLALMAEGLTNRQIAGRLGVSEHTVKFHVDTILGKLGAHSRTDAVTRAARAGLIIL